MTWTWRFETAEGKPVSVKSPPQTFLSQSDAETWLGECWRTLLASGVDQVQLLEDDRVVYGPMNLHPAD